MPPKGRPKKFLEVPKCFSFFCVLNSPVTSTLEGLLAEAANCIRCKYKKECAWASIVRELISMKELLGRLIRKENKSEQE